MPVQSNQSDRHVPPPAPAPLPLPAPNNNQQAKKNDKIYFEQQKLLFVLIAARSLYPGMFGFIYNQIFAYILTILNNFLFFQIQHKVIYLYLFILLFN